MHLMCVLMPWHLLTEPRPLDALLAFTLETAASKKKNTYLNSPFGIKWIKEYFCLALVSFKDIWDNSCCPA